MLSSLYLLVVYLNLNFKILKTINVNTCNKVTFLLIFFVLKSFKAN